MSDTSDSKLRDSILIVDFSKIDSDAAQAGLRNFLVVKYLSFFYRKVSRIFKNYIRNLFAYKWIAKRFKPPVLTRPLEVGSMLGAGIKYKDKEYTTHSTLPVSLSAIKTFSKTQIFIILGFAVFFIYGLTIAPILILKIIVSIISILYFLDALLNIIIVVRSLQRPDEIKFNKAEILAIDDSTLPIYTVLCPLYKEAHILPQFIEGIRKLNYPKEKLDIILLLEEDDKETLKLLKKITLPFYIRKVVVPNSLPKTKPKACNYGLNLAKGEYLVIYDAEDIPDPFQLKKAYLGFKKAPKDVACLQAKLDYYNPRRNLLTKFFTVEYALWFDIMLTGLQSFNSSLPLGGTSNHFKTKRLKALHGWDPFNVTEDADLGVRLFQKGFRTAVIDSTTYEEATSQFKNWVRQRSRWTKGYMQTYLVHTRNVKDFVKEKGFMHYFIFQLTVGGKVLFALLNPLLWVITVLYFTSYAVAGPLLESIYTPPISYVAVASWIFGNFLFAYYYMVACGRRNEWDLMKYIFLIPIYWAMMSFSGFVALYQLIVKPHYWEKTVHGVHLSEKLERYKIKTSIAIPTQIITILSYIKAGSRITSNNLLSFIEIFYSPENAEPEKAEHVLIFNWRDSTHIYSGGAEVYIQELAKRWVKQGKKVTIFCGNDNKNSLNTKVDGVEIVRRGGTYSVYLFAFFYYIFRFRKTVSLIVDCENGIPFFSPLYSRKPVILLVHHVHQEIFREFLKFPLRQIAAFLEGKVMPLIYKDTQIVTVSNSSMQDILKLGFVKPEKIKIIPNGVEQIEDLNFVKTPDPSFLYLGRLKKYKNVDVAIKAFAKLSKEFPKSTFSIAGSGETFPKLKKLTESLKISMRVKFLGRVTDEQKRELYSSSWVVLQPSQMEGWGITVIEANSYGTPVIASNVAGLKDSVINKKTGILVNPRDVNDLYLSMKELIANRQLLSQLSQNSLKWSEYFSWDKSADEFDLLIDKTIAEKRFRTRKTLSVQPNSNLNSI